MAELSKQLQRFVETLAGMDEAAFLAALEKWIRGDHDHGLPAPPVRDEGPAGVVYDAVRLAGGDFRRRAAKAIADLLERAEPSPANAEYIGRLLHLAGMLKVEEAVVFIVGAALTDRLKGLEGDGEELHSRALRVLLGLHPDGGVGEVWKAGVDDPRYAATCFRGLWRTNREEALAALPRLLLSAQAPNAHVNLRLLLKRFLDETGVRLADLDAHIPHTLDGVKGDDWRRAREQAARAIAGIPGLDGPERDRLVSRLRWDWKRLRESSPHEFQPRLRAPERNLGMAA